MNPESASRIGKYEIIETLGKGAMGVVYKGFDPVIQRHVAIKTIIRNTDETDAADTHKRFRREAQAGGNLHHPNIVGIYEYGEDGDSAYIAMEYVQGVSLADRMKQAQPFLDQEIGNIMGQLLAALQHAHDLGIVHRDIKPANIMLAADGSVKVADFGIARMQSSTLTLAGTILGTPGYMSPEQLTGQAADFRSDIYSAGVVLYEMLTGERAFYGSNIPSVIYKVINTTLLPPSHLRSGIPVAFDGVVARAVAKQPEARYPSARAFADDVAHALQQFQHSQGPLVAGLPVHPPEQWRTAETVTSEDQMQFQRPQASAAGATRRKKKWVLLTSLLSLAALGLLFWTYSPNVGPKRRNISFKPGAVFQDCPSCPSLAVIPAGQFVQGSLISELDREENEGPRQLVKIDYPLAVGRYEVTRAEYEQFVQDTGYQASGCEIYDGKWHQDARRSWQSPGYSQGPNHPVTCISWTDAQAYVEWLSRKTRKSYRLLSSSEWEYVARAGSQTAQIWKEQAASACMVGNVADQSADKRYPGWQVFDCNDNYANTAPVGSFEPNAMGIFDMAGNVFEWVGDCWNDSYQGSPTDGSAWMTGNCGLHVLRGGSWFSQPRYLRAAFRNRFESGHRSSTFGFRVARRIEP